MIKIVQTKSGKVQGTTKTTFNGKQYSAFLGIPYAEKPLGELRFRDPQPVEPWTDILDATNCITCAPQIRHFDINNYTEKRERKFFGQEDCLRLNIFSPANNSQEKLPVLVWIHGGSFVNGSNSPVIHGPDYFIEKNIVFVPINYRLGVLGFLSFDDESLEIPGNAGLKDQSMALRWIKENIEHFGGDPNKITLAGQSAGAACVHLHMISSMSKNLFNRAILQSGNALCPWVILPRLEADKKYEYDLARALGWNGQGGDHGAFEVISSCPLEKLIWASFSIDVNQESDELAAVETFVPFKPKIEKFKSGFTFLEKSLEELMRDAWSKDIDIIVGQNEHEGSMFMPIFGSKSSFYEQNFHLFLPLNVRSGKTKEEILSMSESIKKSYFVGQEYNFNYFEPFLTDLEYSQPLYRHCLNRLESKGKTFLYLLSTNAEPQLKFYQICRDMCFLTHMDGCAHCDDIPLIFLSTLSAPISPEHTVYKAFVNFFNAYTNFIKTGNPNNEGLEVTWKAVNDEKLDDNNLVCLRISDEKVKMVDSPLRARFRVLDQLYMKIK